VHQGLLRKKFWTKLIGPFFVISTSLRGWGEILSSTKCIEVYRATLLVHNEIFHQQKLGSMSKLERSSSSRVVNLRNPGPRAAVTIFTLTFMLLRCWERSVIRSRCELAGDDEPSDAAAVATRPLNTGVEARATLPRARSLNGASRLKWRGSAQVPAHTSLSTHERDESGSASHFFNGPPTHAACTKNYIPLGEIYAAAAFSNYSHTSVRARSAWDAQVWQAN
jgi:hypothetical protein